MEPAGCLCLRAPVQGMISIAAAQNFFYDNCQDEISMESLDDFVGVDWGRSQAIETPRRSNCLTAVQFQ